MAFRSSSSVMFRYRWVCLMSAWPSINLDRADVYSVAQEPTGALVTEVVPVQVDLPQLDAINASTRFRALRVVAVREN